MSVHVVPSLPFGAAVSRKAGILPLECCRLRAFQHGRRAECVRRLALSNFSVTGKYPRRLVGQPAQYRPCRIDQRVVASRFCLVSRVKYITAGTLPVQGLC
eukprot:1185363-Prorocentrum_minimum.AAC.5